MDRAYSNLSALTEEEADDESIKDGKRDSHKLHYMDSLNDDEEPLSPTLEEDRHETRCDPESGVDTSDEPNKFDGLCDGVLNATALLHTSLDELLELKDDLLKSSLPPAMMVKLTMVTSRLFRSMSDVHMPINELIRLVKVYSTPWEENSTSLKKLHEDYERKQRQLNIAIRRLQLVDEHSKRISREKRIMNWEKLFAKLTTRRGHGRRWKFLIEAIKGKAKLGDEHIEALREEMDESSDDEEEEVDIGEHHSPTFPDDNAQALEENGEKDSESEDNEVEMMTAGKSLKINLVDESYTSDDVSQNDADREDAVVKPLMVDASCWTHEPQYDWSLHMRLFAPEGLEYRQLKCTASMSKQIHKTGVLDLLISEDSMEDITDIPDKPTKNHSQDSRDKALASPQEPDSRHYEEIHFSVPESVFSPETDTSQMNISIAVLYGPHDEMVAMGTVDMDDIQLLDLPTVTLPPPHGDDLPVSGSYKEPTSAPDLSECEPIAFPLYSLHAGLKGATQSSTGAIPLLFYWGKTLKPATFTRQTATQNVNDLVFGLTGIDLDVTSKEDLVKDMVDEAVSVMSTTPIVPEETIPKSGYEQLIMEHNEEMNLLQQEYESRIRDLLEALHQSQGFNATSSVDLEMRTPGGTLRSRSVSSTHKSGENGRTLRLASTSAKDQSATSSFKDPSPNSPHHLPRPPASSGKPRKNFRIGKRLPNWGETIVQDFFTRLEQYEATSQKNKDDLINRICDEVSRNIEHRLASQHRLNRQKAAITDPLQDISLPALFMPLKSGTVFNPRAHQYFHPTGYNAARLTQPPSVFQLPPLHKSSMARVNLFDLSNTFHKHGPAWLMRRYIDQQQAPLDEPAVGSVESVIPAETMYQDMSLGVNTVGQGTDVLDRQSLRQSVSAED